MRNDLDQASTRLAKASLLKLPDAAGATVAVLWGSIWLTQEGDARDFELHAGQSFTIRANGLTLITAMADAAVSVLEPTLERARAPKQNADASAMPRYIGAAEMAGYERRARELRTQYLASLWTRAGQALARAADWARGRLAAL